MRDLKAVIEDVVASHGAAANDEEPGQIMIWTEEALDKFRAKVGQGENFDVAKMLQAVAFAGLPRKSRGRDVRKDRLSRMLKFGRDKWVFVHYSTDTGYLPSGPLGRLALMYLQDEAIRQRSRLVRLGTKTEVLAAIGKMWAREGKPGGREYNRLRKELKAVCHMNVAFSPGRTREEAELGDAGGRMPPMVESFDLSRKRGADWRIQLSKEFYDRLGDIQQRTWVPYELVRVFSNDDVGLDWLLFVLGRCLRAESRSPVPHAVLMEMFREGEERESKTIHRLRGKHEQVMRALGGVVQAEIVGEPVKDGTRGRPRMEYSLVVGPLRDKGFRKLGT